MAKNIKKRTFGVKGEVDTSQRMMKKLRDTSSEQSVPEQVEAPSTMITSPGGFGEAKANTKAPIVVARKRKSTVMSTGPSHTERLQFQGQKFKSTCDEASSLADKIGKDESYVNHAIHKTALELLGSGELATALLKNVDTYFLGEKRRCDIHVNSEALQEWIQKLDPLNALPISGNMRIIYAVACDQALDTLKKRMN